MAASVFSPPSRDPLFMGQAINPVWQAYFEQFKNMATTDEISRLESTLKVSGSSTSENTGVLIPLYIYPANIFTNADYNNIIATKKKYHRVPLTCVINPSNGPGTVQDGNYLYAIRRLHGAGAKVLGYVHASYCARSIVDVKKDVDWWVELYPEIDGIFVDEMTNDVDTAHMAYFTELTDYCHDSGFFPVIGNPGSGTWNHYFDNGCADIIVIHETGSYPSEATLKGDYAGGYADYHYRVRAALVHSQAWNATTVAMMKQYVGLLYVTDDTLPNPWDSVPSFLESIFITLNS